MGTPLLPQLAVRCLLVLEVRMMVDHQALQLVRLHFLRLRLVLVRLLPHLARH